MLVLRVNDPATIPRAIGLVIVTRPIRELLRDIRFDRLSPQRARHRVHNRTRIRQPRHRARPSGQLWQIHLSEVIRMRKINLLENRVALGKKSPHPAQERDQSNPPKTPPKTQIPSPQLRPVILSEAKDLCIPPAPFDSLYSAGKGR